VFWLNVLHPKRRSALLAPGNIGHMDAMQLCQQRPHLLWQLLTFQQGVEPFEDRSLLRRKQPQTLGKMVSCAHLRQQWTHLATRLPSKGFNLSTQTGAGPCLIPTHPLQHLTFQHIRRHSG
jgi:hypothetical protein